MVAYGRWFLTRGGRYERVDCAHLEAIVKRKGHSPVNSSECHDNPSFSCKGHKERQKFKPFETIFLRTRIGPSVGCLWFVLFKTEKLVFWIKIMLG